MLLFEVVGIEVKIGFGLEIMVVLGERIDMIDDNMVVRFVVEVVEIGRIDVVKLILVDVGCEIGRLEFVKKMFWLEDVGVVFMGFL